MASPGLQQSAVQLLGRERECAVIDRVLADAGRGVGGALVVRGEAGIGKSAMLGYAVQRVASGMLVLRAGGVEAESDLAFAGLHGLLRGVLAHLRELPQPQSAALAGALGLASSTGSDRLLISAAVLGLLAAAAEDRPVLCVVDDAQWLDRPSADALVFAARRLQAERLAMLFGAREAEVRRFEAAGVPDLALTGLDPPSAAAVLAAVLAAGECSAAGEVLDRLLAEAGGNPLALLELPRGLSRAQLEGRAALPDAIPLSPQLEGVFRQRIGRLPQTAQTSLLIAAADTTGDMPAVLRAMARLGLPVDALDPAEGAVLVRISGATITFRHPLVRSALYQGATLSQRQRVHAALAGAFSGEEHADRRVWHLALATLTGDEEVAAALEASARRAQLRAGHASAATAFLRAAELSTDDTRRTRRIAAAAQAAWDAGQPGRARDAIARVLPSADRETRAQLLHLSGVIEARTGSRRDACSRLLEGMELTSDPSLRLEMMSEAAIAAIFSGDLVTVIGLGDRAADVPAPTARDRLMVGVLRSFAKVLGGEHDQAQSLLADTLDQAEALDEPRALVWASKAASTAWGVGSGLPYASRAVEAARRQGLLSLLPVALEALGLELLSTGSFDRAYAAAEEGYRLAADIGHGGGWHLTTMAMVEALWGRETEARHHAEEALAVGQRTAATFLSSIAEHVLGFIDLTLGRPEPAADRMLALTDTGRPDFNPVVVLPMLPDAVEAAVRAGRQEEAGRRLETLRGWVAVAPTKARRALVARCEALLEDRDPDEAFEEATRYAPAVSPLDGARTELIYGEWLRRQRRRTDARVHLRAALEAFRRLGALPWEQRAEAELRATGETARKRDLSVAAQLTPQERQIAGLVAEGLTNREIAAQLFLSPRTVDYHLRKVFTKLGIGSRADLIRAGLSQREPT
jgi:DNA-binding CsgD family transcriptional regulator